MQNSKDRGIDVNRPRGRGHGWSMAEGVSDDSIRGGFPGPREGHKAHPPHDDRIVMLPSDSDAFAYVEPSNWWP